MCWGFCKADFQLGGQKLLSNGSKQAFPDLKPTKTVIETPDKENAVYMSGFFAGHAGRQSGGNRTGTGEFLLGGAHFLPVGEPGPAKRGPGLLGEFDVRLRKQEYLSRWLIMASCNPMSWTKPKKPFVRECDKLVKEGFTEKEVEEGRKALLAQKQNDRSSDWGSLVFWRTPSRAPHRRFLPVPGYKRLKR